MAAADLRALQLDAYKKVVRCFMQGPYDLGKEEALATLRLVLSISNEDHLRVRGEVRAEQQQQAQQGQENTAMHNLAGHAQRASTSPPASPSVPQSSHAASGQPQAAGARQQQQQPAKASRGAAGGAAQPRKRSKAEGGGVEAAPPLEINPFVGRKVQRYWPQDGGWFEGIISDYNAATGEHCIVYDFNLPTESYEWYRIAGASHAEFRLVQGSVDLARLPGVQQFQAAAGRAGGGGSARQPAAQQPQQQVHHGAAGVAARQPAGAPPAGRAAANGGYPSNALRGAGQRVPVSVTRPRLAHDWSSDEDGGEEEGPGSDNEWGPNGAAFSDASD